MQHGNKGDEEKRESEAIRLDVQGANSVSRPSKDGRKKQLQCVSSCVCVCFVF